MRWPCETRNSEQKGFCMEIATTNNGTQTIVKLKGRMDTPAANEAGKALEAALTPECDLLTVDMEEVSYVCSAALRVFLKMQKKVNARSFGSMVLTGCRPVIKEVFEMTGFSGILTIEE